MSSRQLRDALSRPAPEFPERFAPGIFSGSWKQHSRPAFSPDGCLILWSAWEKPYAEGGREDILFVQHTSDGWTSPQVVPFASPSLDHGPEFMPDGETLLFASRRALPGEDPNTGHGSPGRLWTTHHSDGSWSEPVLLEAPFDAAATQTMPTVARDGTLYYLRVRPTPHGQPLDGTICRCRLANGAYDSPEPLPESINLPGTLNWTPYITSNERVLLFSSHRISGSPNGDIYITHRGDTDSWSEPVNLGLPVNTNNQERFPGLSLDGRSLFFVRRNDTYRVSSDVLEHAT